MNKVYFEGFSYKQFGHDLLFTQMRLKTLLALFEVDHAVQRELDIQRRHEIRTFILNNLENGRDFHFSPFVFSARATIKKDEQGYYLVPGSKIYISDGQHRSAALESALMSLKNSVEASQYIQNEERVKQLKMHVDVLENFMIPMQIYLDLSTKQEMQMFSDLNTERREAHPGQLLQFDHRDLYSILTRQLAERLQGDMEIEMKSARVLNSSSALTSLVIMKRCLIALFDGLLIQRPGEANFYYSQQEVEKIGETFFLKWLEIFPKHAHNRYKYVAGLSGIQIALALTVHHFIKEQKILYAEAIELLTHLKKCSWQHKDPIFDFLYSQEKKSLSGHSNGSAIKRLKNAFIHSIEQEMAVKQ